MEEFRYNVNRLYTTDESRRPKRESETTEKFNTTFVSERGLINFLLHTKWYLGWRNWKLVELYNIKEDPTEANEVSDEHPEVVNKLLARLADYYVSFL